MKEVELAIGVPVMVTMNIHTDMDLANGVKGVIEGIVLDECERVIIDVNTEGNAISSTSLSSSICAC